jgi:hypothetical protein
MSFSKTVSVFAALASIFAAGATGWKLANSQQEVPLNPLDQKVMELEKKIEEVTTENPIDQVVQPQVELQPKPTIPPVPPLPPLPAPTEDTNEQTP